MEASVDIKCNDLIHHFAVELLFLFRFTLLLVSAISYFWFFSRKNAKHISIKSFLLVQVINK